MLTLYDYFRSSACFRVRIALNIKKLSYEVIPVHLVKDGGEQFSKQYQAINPQSLVPTLQEGDHVITQSLAIIEYLDEAFPLPTLLSNNLIEKAHIRSFALSIIADLHPLNNLRVLTYLSQTLKISEEQKQQWYQHWIAKGLEPLEKRLNQVATTGHFCFGNRPTLADICLVPQLFNARRFSCDMSAYPTLTRIDANCQTLPEFSNAFPRE